MKPMLAGKCEDVDALRYPLYVSPKLDGIRAMVIDGVLVSRNMKPIPNRHVQKLFGLKTFHGLDGELIVGPVDRPDTFNTTTSAVMSIEGTPDAVFHVFDDWRSPGTPFHMRLDNLRNRVKMLKRENVIMVPHVHCGTADLLTTLEEEFLGQGFEGAMIRASQGPYKFGRSTAREGWLLKLKRFEDSEATIIDVEELEHNQNEKTRDELGRAKRSSHKAGKVAGGTLGALLVQDCYSSVQFNVGSGFTAAARAALWEQRHALKGKIIKYRYFPTGSKEKPRFPTFLGFRDPRDMSCN